MTVKVYRVQPDVNRYRYFLPKEDAIWSTDTLTLDCKSRKQDWQPFQVFVYKPLHKTGNFFGLGPGGLVLDDKAVELLRTFIEMSGELLPVHFDDQVYHLWNVTECIAALDEERTTWHVPNVKSLIDRYAFDESRFSESSVFKIPETCKGEVFAYEGIKDPEDEFKFNVESMKLVGLNFEKVWESFE